MTERHWYDWLWVPLVVSWLLPLYTIQFVWITFVVMAASLGGVEVTVPDWSREGVDPGLGV